MEIIDESEIPKKLAQKIQPLILSDTLPKSILFFDDPHVAKIVLSAESRKREAEKETA